MNTTTTSMITQSGRMAIVTHTTMIEPCNVYGIIVDRVNCETRTFDDEYTSTFYYLSNGTQFSNITVAEYSSILDSNNCDKV
jgi:hypothetical protein